MKEIHIDNKTIGPDTQLFLIAEAGVNHNGDLSLAKKLVDVAVKAEVDAIKFQTFKTEELILKNTSKAEYQKVNTNDNESFYDMLKKYEFSFEEFKDLKKYCEKNKMTFLSTPFDPVSVQWLDDLNVSVYKVGSGDMNNFPLLKAICLKKKPILLSTGMATLDDVKKSIKFLEENNTKSIMIFQCTTNYPVSYEDINLNVIDSYKELFPNYLIGFSDHSLGIEASIGAVVKGVKAIEKHFTLDKNLEGPDHKASLNPIELFKWVKSIRNIELALGSNVKKLNQKEIEIAQIARKSIVSTKNLEIGDLLTEKNITIKRPGIGISPAKYYTIIGKKIKRSISKDTIIKWEDLE